MERRQMLLSFGIAIGLSMSGLNYAAEGPRDQAVSFPTRDPLLVL